MLDRLEQSLHAGTVNVLKEKQPEQVTRRWDAEVKVPFQPRIPVIPNVSAAQVFDEATVAGRLLILGAPGSGKTTMLLELCQELVARAEANVDEPMPMRRLEEYGSLCVEPRHHRRSDLSS